MLLSEKVRKLVFDKYNSSNQLSRYNHIEGVANMAKKLANIYGVDEEKASEIVKAIVDDFHPDLVIVVDALACSNPKRMCHSIQLSTAGINPGSGVGNKRKEISKSSIGVDVLAIGIPTVSDIDCFVEMENDFFVTPKDIDLAMDVLSSIIAEGINMALYE